MSLIPTSGCTPTDLKTNTAFGCIDCLSAHEKQAIVVWALCLEAAALTSSTCDLTDAAEDAACFTCESKSALDTMRVLNTMQEAVAFGATVTQDLAEIKDQIACLICRDPHYLKAMEIFLRCVVSKYRLGILDELGGLLLNEGQRIVVPGL